MTKNIEIVISHANDMFCCSHSEIIPSADHKLIQTTLIVRIPLRGKEALIYSLDWLTRKELDMQVQEFYIGLDRGKETSHYEGGCLTPSKNRSVSHGLLTCLTIPLPFPPSLSEAFVYLRRNTAL